MAANLKEQIKKLIVDFLDFEAIQKIKDYCKGDKFCFNEMAMSTAFLAYFKKRIEKVIDFSIEELIVDVKNNETKTSEPIEEDEEGFDDLELIKAPCENMKKLEKTRIEDCVSMLKHSNNAFSKNFGNNSQKGEDFSQIEHQQQIALKDFLFEKTEKTNKTEKESEKEKTDKEEEEINWEELSDEEKEQELKRRFKESIKVKAKKLVFNSLAYSDQDLDPFWLEPFKMEEVFQALPKTKAFLYYKPFWQNVYGRPVKVIKIPPQERAEIRAFKIKTLKRVIEAKEESKKTWEAQKKEA